jgi:hypothetical protein
MASSAKPSAAKASGWQSCEFCSKQPAGDSYDVFQDNGYKADYSHLERPADSREQLLEMLLDLNLHRCPVCHTYYLSSSESDPHHYMSYTHSIGRVSDEVALHELASIKTQTAEKWLRELRAKPRKS